MTQPFVAAQVLGAHHPVLRARVAECGNLFRFETHVESRNEINSGIGLRVSCLCPNGHGVSGRRWNGWLEPYMGRYDLVVADYVPVEAADQSPASEQGEQDGEVLTLTVRPLSLAA
jgi:hypothetical protein